MHITTKLAAALMVATTIVLGLYGYWQLEQERLDLHRSAEDSLRLLGTAVEVAIENAVRDQQIADVQEVLESMDLKDPAVDAFVFDVSGEPTSPLGSPHSLALASALLAESMNTDRAVLRTETSGDVPIIVAAIPLRSDSGARIGTLALTRPLHELQQDLLATRRSIVASIVTLVGVLSLVSWLLIVLYVRRPLTRLAGAMDAVRSGDLTTRVSFTPGDEIGDVGAEFNAMVAKLAEARATLATETESRQALEAGLQRVDKLVTLGQLSAGLAHEIGSPLQVLNGRARALAARSDLASDVRRTVSILAEQSERIARIVDQLLHCTRRRPTRWDTLDLAAVARPIRDLLETEARRRGIRLGFVAQGAIPSILGDADKIQQVVLNLLKNALQVTASGGTVELRLTSAPRGGSPVSDAQLAVEDTGPGISAEAAERIFDPFFTTREASGGTGLGLAVVKSIVTEHFGSIEVHPGSHGGACFSVRFPPAPETLARGLVA